MNMINRIVDWYLDLSLPKAFAVSTALVMIGFAILILFTLWSSLSCPS